MQVVHRAFELTELPIDFLRSLTNKAKNRDKETDHNSVSNIQYRFLLCWCLCCCLVLGLHQNLPPCQSHQAYKTMQKNKTGNGRRNQRDLRRRLQQMYLR